MWLTTEEVAARYKVPTKTVEAWRYKGVGPKGIRVGRHVRYSEDALLEWEREQADCPRAV